jgi:protein-S-isoprenylcysteine O-methyltransferase Ste14
MKNWIFIIDVAINYVLLFGALWSIAYPNKRVWPPPRKWSWQYIITWALFYAAFGLNAALVILDWNTWMIPDEIRLFLGIPVMLVGALLVTWGIFTLGVKNTYGLKDGFISDGPYMFTRNPQYLGDIILFVGIGLIANSLAVLIVHLLMSLVFLITPISEEVWLEKQYGDDYLTYKKSTARFL